MLLYTEKQLHTAYKVFIQEYCQNNEIPEIETFRTMFEDSFFIQSLCEREINEH